MSSQGAALNVIFDAGSTAFSHGGQYHLPWCRIIILITFELVCYATVTVNGVWFTYGSLAGVMYLSSQQTRHIYPMFAQCWPTVYDVGPTLVNHRVDV